MAFPDLTFLQNGGFTISDGFTSQDGTPRLLADVDGNGALDIVGFGGSRVFVSYQGFDAGTGFPTGTFSLRRELTFGQGFNFTPLQGFISQNTSIRAFGDIDADGDDDLLAFTPTGIVLSTNAGTTLDGDYRNDGAIGFQTIVPVDITAAAGGTTFTEVARWIDQDTTPRFFTDIDGDGDADIIGFDTDGTFYSINGGVAGFGPGTASNFTAGGAAFPPFFSVAQGWTSQTETPRLLGDVNNDGFLDIVGFGEDIVVDPTTDPVTTADGVFLAFGDGAGNFALNAPQTIGGDADFVDGIWSNQDTAPRFLVDFNGDNFLDIVGLGPSSIFVSLWNPGTGLFTDSVEFENDVASFTSQNATPTFFTDLSGDGLADILTFGDSEVSVSENVVDLTDPDTDAYGEEETVTIGAPKLFTINNGGWSNQDETPRFLTDTDGDGDSDILGFGGNQVFISVNENGSFGEATGFDISGVTGFTANNGGWTSQNTTTRLIGDVNNDNIADVIGFGGAGRVFRALGTGTGFGVSSEIFFSGDTSFTTTDGWTSQNETPRHLIDLNGDGFDDMIGFGGTSVFVSINNFGIFGEVTQVEITGETGFTINNGGWINQNETPRLLGDVTGDGNADILGFGGGAVFLAEGAGDGTFDDAELIDFDGGTQFTIAQGWTSQDLTPRELADVDDDGDLDIVGFGGNTVFAALNNGSGSFGELEEINFDGLNQFNINNGGWASQSLTPRLFGDLDGNGNNGELLAFGGTSIFGSEVTV